VGIAGLLSICIAVMAASAAARGDGFKDLVACFDADSHGNFDAAISLCTRALNSAVKDDSTFQATAHDGRGFAYLHMGEYDQALSDFNDALAIQPRYANALKNRSFVRRFKGDKAKAMDDLTQASMEGSTDSYTVLWLYITRRELNDADAFDGLEREGAEVHAANYYDEGWPYAIVQRYRNKITDAMLMEEAQRGDTSTLDKRLCEASFYLGQHDLLNGLPSAKRHFNDAKRVCAPASIEAMMLKNER
jgi:lipoprotein NlpI